MGCRHGFNSAKVNRLMALFIAPARFTDTREFELMAVNAISRDAFNFLFDGVYWMDANIVDSSAEPATDMIMFFRVTVIAHIGSTQSDFLDFACLQEDFKVTVDGPQAYPRKFFTYHYINLIRGWVGIYFA